MGASALETESLPGSRPTRRRRASGRPPAAIAAYPGALGRREAVFEVGSGWHGFTGPALEA
jgi:hypothetical protein